MLRRPICSRPVRRTGRSVDRASNRDPQIPAQSMDSCAMYGSTDCAAQSMDCADPQIAPNIYNQNVLAPLTMNSEYDQEAR